MAWIIGWDLVLEYALGAGYCWGELVPIFPRIARINSEFICPTVLICSPWETLKLSDGTVIEGDIIRLTAYFYCGFIVVVVNSWY